MLVSTVFQEGGGGVGGGKAYKVFQWTVVENVQNMEKDINVQTPKLDELQNTEQTNPQEDAQ